MEEKTISAPETTASAPEREWNIDAAEIMDGIEDADADVEAEAQAEALAAESGETAPAQGEEFTLRHLDDVVNVGRDKVVELAQKGLDYDRVREKLENARDELARFRDWLTDAAGGQDIDEFRASLSAKARAERDGITEQEARARIDLERAKHSGEPTPGDRRRREAREFAAAHPDVAAKLVSDPGAIPDEVWRRVRAGESLLDAFEKHKAKADAEASSGRIRELEQQLAGTRQAKTNAARSTGSMDSDGGDAGADPVAAGWNAV